MAHHNSTLESVLKASVSVPVVIHENTGRSRAQRRHVAVPPTGKRFFVPKGRQAPATNQPYRRLP